MKYNPKICPACMEKGKRVVMVKVAEDATSKTWRCMTVYGGCGFVDFVPTMTAAGSTPKLIEGNPAKE